MKSYIHIVLTVFSDGSKSNSLTIGNAHAIKISAKAAKEIINLNGLLCWKETTLTSGTTSKHYRMEFKTY